MFLMMKLQSFDNFKCCDSTETPIQVVSPDGCVGFVFAFDSEESAREFDADAELLEVEIAARREEKDRE